MERDTPVSGVGKGGAKKGAGREGDGRTERRRSKFRKGESHQLFFLIKILIFSSIAYLQWSVNLVLVVVDVG